MCVRSSLVIRNTNTHTGAGAFPYEDEESTSASSVASTSTSTREQDLEEAADPEGERGGGKLAARQTDAEDDACAQENAGMVGQTDGYSDGYSTPYVADLSTFTADRFFLDTSRQIKAVLFTKKTHVPSLWRQVAAQYAHLALFGVVRESEVISKPQTPSPKPQILTPNPETLNPKP